MRTQNPSPLLYLVLLKNLTEQESRDLPLLCHSFVGTPDLLRAGRPRHPQCAVQVLSSDQPQGNGGEEEEEEEEGGAHGRPDSTGWPRSQTTAVEAVVMVLSLQYRIPY